MKRRTFLKNTAIGGMAVSNLVLNACQTPGTQQGNKGGAPPAGSTGPDLQEATLTDLQAKMRSGEMTARSIAEWYLRRIAAIDKDGPALNAVIELNPEALSIADSLDRERQAGRVRGPLHGIPVLVKDNIDTGDQMMTTAGSVALEGHRAARDAFIIRRLREAGAVVLGKTNLSEWANFRSTRSTSAWSSRGGQTKNPHAVARNTSGSSSGSGAAVAAGLCAVAIGTETDGSIISPSSCCGIVGIKPTVGLLSRSGIIPISHTQDTAGPMARSVRDAAILLGVLAGVDPDDAATQAGEGRMHADYTQFLVPDGLKGKRIGVEKTFFDVHPGVSALYRQAIEVLKSQGATVVEVDLLKETRPLSDAEFTVLQYEFKAGLNRYFAGSNTKIKSLAELIAFNKQHEERAMPFFKQELLEMSDAKGDLDTREYQEALAKSLRSRRLIDELMRRERLDAIAAASDGVACLIDQIAGDYGTGPSFSSPAAMSGYPHITIPMGQVHGLPVGFSFMAGAWQEPALLAMGYAFEQATKAWKAPVCEG